MAAEDQSEKKANPFKDLPRPAQPQVAKESKEKSSQPKESKEITIRLRPWKMAKVLLVVVLLLGVFYAGRLTAGNTSLELPDFSKYFSSEAGPSGLVTGDAAENKSETGSAELAAEVKEESPEAAPEVASNTSTEEVQPEDDTPEKFTTEGYSQVTLSLDHVYKDWKGTWGKIKGIEYTITNNEVGTIKPHHFIMLVEGYDAGENKNEKHFDVGIASQKVKSEQALTDEAAVSGGYAYNAVSMPDGDLTKVMISLVLVDVNWEIIASIHQEVNLQG